jgi:hypothetical protein
MEALFDFDIVICSITRQTILHTQLDSTCRQINLRRSFGEEFKMLTAVILVLVFGGLSCLSTTAESRAEARAKMARLNWLWITILMLEWAFILYPWPPYHPQY